VINDYLDYDHYSKLNFDLLKVERYFDGINYHILDFKMNWSNC